MQKIISLTFNSGGVLIDESIDAIRQGDDDVKLVTTFQSKNNANYVAKYTLTRPDGKTVKGIMSASSLVSTDFEKVLDSAYYFALNGTATLTVFLFSSDSVLAQGQVSIPIEATDFDEETTITPDEYNDLVNLIASKLNITAGIVKAQEENDIEISAHTNGQVFFIVEDKKLVQLQNGSLESVIDFAEMDAKIITNVVVSSVKTGTGNIFQLSFINDNGQTLFVKSISLTGATETEAGLVNTYDQSWKGVKSFADLPQTKEGRVYNNDRQITDKGYVDNAIDDMKEEIEADVEEIAGEHDVINSRLDTIEGKIPSQASSSNKLADKDFVNSTVNSLAAFYITKNAQGDPFETKAELQSATTFYSGGQVRVPTRNDYCLVRVDETHDDASCRYIYQGNQWEFQFVVNETPLTQAQVQAINSGITASLVSQITTNKNDIANLDENKVGLVEATQKFQSKIVSVDISISPSDWDDSKHFQSENVFGTLGFVNTDDTFYFVGISTEDDAYINTFRLDVVDVSSSDDEHTYVSFSCGEIPTETINIRIGLIKKNAILGDMVGYLNVADLDGTTIAFQNGKVRVIGSGVQVDATQVEVTTTHTSVQANIIRIDGEINRVEEKIPDAPSTDGNYTLKCSVAVGVKTYSWVLDE